MSVVNEVAGQFTGISITETQPTHRTYRIDWENKRISGMVDGKEAAIQQVKKGLLTKRYAYLIYDDQYGNDLFNKVGNADLDPEYLDNDVPEMISDCVIPDDYVDGVEKVDFKIEDEDKVDIYVEVNTIFGDVSIEGSLTDG